MAHNAVPNIPAPKRSVPVFLYEPEAMEFLRGIPRYENTAFRSMVKRGKFFTSILYCRLFRKRRPLMVVLVTNAKCNLSCSYCYGCYGYTRTQREYSTKELIEIIDELWRLGTRYLTVHGGEALLRDDIGLLLNYMKHKGFYVSVNTNGVLIPEKINDMKCVDSVVISLDGKEEHNDRYRGKGSFKKAVEAMKLVVRNRIPLVVSATLMRSSMDDAQYLLKLTHDIGGRFQFGILYNADKFADKGRGISDGEIREAVREFLELKKKGYPVYYSEGTLRAAIDWPFSYNKKYYATGKEKESYGGRIICFHGVLKYQIDADGRVVTCWRHNNDDAPNIKDLGIKDAFAACSERKQKTCEYCAFLANNEHNALFGLILRSTFDMMFLQIQDALKIKR